MTQALNLALLGNNVNTSGQVSLTAAVSGTLPVANGGTGQTSLTAGSLVAGNGTSAVSLIAPGTSGNVLTSNGSAWTSAASSSVYVGQKAQVFTSSGTFTVPTGVTAVKVTVIGGGGGGAGTNGSSIVSGGTGGTSSFGAYCSATGAVGGASAAGGGSGGSGSGGDFNYTGTRGGDVSTGAYSGAGGGQMLVSAKYPASNVSAELVYERGGGLLGGLGGAWRSATSNQNGVAGTAYGCGGSGAVRTNGCFYVATPGGGGGGASIEFITGLTPGGTVAVTVGAGGAGGSSTNAGGAGSAGVVLVEW